MSFQTDFCHLPKLNRFILIQKTIKGSNVMKYIVILDKSSSKNLEFLFIKLKVKYLFLMKTLGFISFVEQSEFQPKQLFSKMLINFNKINLHSSTEIKKSSMEK